jgi:rod shape-determining protein MreC
VAVSLGGSRANARGAARLGSRAPVRATGAAVDVALLGISALAAVVLIALPGELRDRTAATLRRTAVAPLVELQRVAEVQRAKYLSYDERVAQRATLARDAADVTGLRAENDRLRRTLGLGARLRWGFVAAEAIPTQSAGELARQPILLSFMLTQGSRAGVAPFAPVVAPEGLVGMVERVDPAMSMAITYAHPDFRVSAQTPEGTAFGIVQPHLGTGSDRALLEMRGVPFRSPLKPGQLVVSSGQGGTYPRGIPVGTVIREIQTVERWARTYLLQPTVSLSDVGPVIVLRQPRAVAGVDSVWTSLASADSAARRVAAAGDSIARDALLREAAARRAALEAASRDSTARDSAGGVSPSDAGTPDAGTPDAGTPGVGTAGTATPPVAAPRPRTPTPESAAPSSAEPTADPSPPARTPPPPRPTVPRPSAPSSTPRPAGAPPTAPPEPQTAAVARPASRQRPFGSTARVDGPDTRIAARTAARTSDSTAADGRAAAATARPTVPRPTVPPRPSTPRTGAPIPRDSAGGEIAATRRAGASRSSTDTATAAPSRPASRPPAPATVVATAGARSTPRAPAAPTAGRTPPATPDSIARPTAAARPAVRPAARPPVRPAPRTTDTSAARRAAARAAARATPRPGGAAATTAIPRATAPVPRPPAAPPRGGTGGDA